MTRMRALLRGTNSSQSPVERDCLEPVIMMLTRYKIFADRFHCCPRQVFDGVRMEPSYN